MYDSEDESNFSYTDGSHLPYALRTFNRIWQKEEDEKLVAEFLAQGLQLRSEFTTSSAQKLLCIGNTKSCHYPYIQKIIETAKPQIIVHTGNFVEEVKAGSIPNVQEEYTQAALQLAEILKNSGAQKVYVSFGKNDIPEVLMEHLPFAEFSLPESLVRNITNGWSLTLLPEQKVHTFAMPQCYHWNRI